VESKYLEDLQTKPTEEGGLSMTDIQLVCWLVGVKTRINWFNKMLQIAPNQEWIENIKAKTGKTISLDSNGRVQMASP
jgi:hypothetical protein